MRMLQEQEESTPGDLGRRIATPQRSWKRDHSEWSIMMLEINSARL